MKEIIARFMKKAFHIILILISLKSLGQEVLVSSVVDPDFRFGGRMSNELFVKLTPSEQNLYLGCLSSLGLKMDSVEWCDNEFVRQMSSHEISPSLKVSWKFTNGIEDGVEILKIGTDTLPKPQCIVFIRRFKHDTMFTFQMYY
jgi:hypothetical protein